VENLHFDEFLYCSESSDTLWAQVHGLLSVVPKLGEIDLGHGPSAVNTDSADCYHTLSQCPGTLA